MSFVGPLQPRNPARPALAAREARPECRAAETRRLATCRTVLPLAAALAAGPAILPAQQRAPAGSQEEPAATLVERLTVNIVNIDVHVTDRRGRPVDDLQASDFEVFEDGRPVTVANFLNAANRPDDREWTEGDELDSLDDAEPPLMVALYLDLFHTRHAHLRRIADDLATFLGTSQQQGGIRFLLATGEPELNVRVPFTSDPASLLAALEELHSRPPTAVHDDEVLRRQAVREVRTAYETCAQPSANQFAECVPCVDMWPGFLGSANHYAAEMEARSTRSTNSLGELITALGGLTGPKALVYVSDGLPQRPGADMYHYLGEICPDQSTETTAMERERDQTTLLNRLSAFSNANRVTIYPVDAGGVRASSASDVSVAGSVGVEGAGGLGASRLAPALVPSGDNDRVRVDNLQNTLNLLADETGGRAVLNQASPGPALQEIAADFGSYYSLGYDAAPDSRHPIRQIEVRLTRPRKGWQVRYRRTYIFKGEEQRLADRLFSALRLNEQTNPLGAEVTFGDPEASTASGETVTLPVEVGLPASALAYLPGADGRRGAVRIFLIAETANGGRTAMRQKVLEVAPPAESPEPGDQARVVVNVDLPPGRFGVAVGVRDEVSGRASFLVRRSSLP